MWGYTVIGDCGYKYFRRDENYSYNVYTNTVTIALCVIAKKWEERLTTKGVT